MANNCLETALSKLKALEAENVKTKFDIGEAREMLQTLDNIRNQTMSNIDNFNAGDNYSSRAQEYLNRKKISRQQRYKMLTDRIIKETALTNAVDNAKSAPKFLEKTMEYIEKRMFGKMGVLQSAFSHSLRDEAAKAGVDINVVRKIVNSNKLQLETKQAMFALSDGADMSHLPKEAVAIAKAYKRAYDVELDLKQRAGIAVLKNKRYHYPVSYNREKIEALVKAKGESAARDEFVGKMMSAIDLDKSFIGMSEKKIRESLGKTFDEILDTDMAQVSATDALSFDESVNPQVSSFTKSRNFVFKDADLQHEIDQLFGIDNLADTYSRQASRTARWAALTETLGTDPKETLENVLRAVEKSKGEVANDSKIRLALDDLMGRNSVPLKGFIPKLAANFRAVTSMALQGGTIFVSLTDMGSFAHNLGQELGTNGVSGMMKNFKDSFEAAALTFKGEDRRQFAEMMAVYMDQTMGDLAHRIGSHHQGSKMSKTLNWYFQLNLLSPFTESMKVGHAAALSYRLAAHRGKKFADLNPGLQRSLKNAGFTEFDWRLMTAQTDKFKNRDYITMEAIDRAEAKDLGMSSSMDLSKSKRELKLKLATYMNEQAMTATPIPSVTTRATLRFGTKDRDTLAGALADVSTQFLSFPISIAEKNLKKTILGGGAESVSDAFSKQNALGTIGRLSQFAGSLMLFAYMGDVARDASRNQTPKDPTNPETILNMFTRSGAGGIYADAIVNLAAGRGFIPTSPLERSLNDLGATTGDILQAIFTEDRELGDVKFKRLTRAVMNLVPFQNHFAIKGALDYHFLYNMNESFSPGYLRRLEDRMEDLGQETLFTRDVAR